MHGQIKSMILKKKYWQNNAFLQHSQCQQTKWNQQWIMWIHLGNISVYI